MESGDRRRQGSQETGVRRQEETGAVAAKLGTQVVFRRIPAGQVLQAKQIARSLFFELRPKCAPRQILELPLLSPVSCLLTPVSPILVHPGIAAPHPPGDAMNRLDRDRRAAPDARAICRRLVPSGPASDQLRPEREGGALGRLHRMDRTAPLPQEVALRASRLAEPQKVPGPVNVLPLEGRRAQPEEGGCPPQVVFGEVDESHLPAALGTTRYARKLEGLHGSQDSAKWDLKRESLDRHDCLCFHCVIAMAFHITNTS